MAGRGGRVLHDFQSLKRETLGGLGYRIATLTIYDLLSESRTPPLSLPLVPLALF